MMTLGNKNRSILSDRRTLLKAGAGGAAFLAAPRVLKAANLEAVTFQLDWIAYGRHAPYYVALEKGFYAENGLEVKIEQGTGAMPGLRYLAAGRAQFVFQDFASMIALRSRDGIKMKALACMYQKAPHAAFYLKNKGIGKPKDFEGKTIAFSPGDSPKVMFPAFAGASGIDESKLSWLAVDPNSKNAVLLNHKTEGMITFIFTRPVLEKAAQGGDEIGAFLYSDYGLQLYGSGILAMEDYIAKNPKICRGFVQASVKGYAYTLDNAAEAAAIMKKYQPQLDAETAAKEVPLLAQLGVTDETKRRGIGTMNAEMMAATEELTRKYLGLSTQVAAGDLFTTDFLG